MLTEQAVQKCLEALKEYVNSLVKECPEAETFLKIRLEHCKRVAELANAYHDFLNWSREDLYLAKIIGHLHDIGKLKQYSISTWKDGSIVSLDATVTKDHGDYGKELLEENNLIRTFIEDSSYDDVILSCIEFHNKLTVPDDLNEHTRKFVDWIRDADKVDILYQYTTEFPVEHYDYVLCCSWKEIRKPESFQITPAVLNQFLAHRMIDSRTMAQPIDHIVQTISYVYDINYKETYTLLLARGTFHEIFSRAHGVWYQCLDNLADVVKHAERYCQNQQIGPLKQQIFFYAASIQNETLRKITMKTLLDCSDNFFSVMGSYNHHTYGKGLAEHSLEAATIADAIAKVKPDVNRDLLVSAALLHDVGKVVTMCNHEQWLYIGHTICGDEIIRNEAKSLGVENEEIVMLLRHCILSHHENAIKPATLEAKELKYADAASAAQAESGKNPNTLSPAWKNEE